MSKAEVIDIASKFTLFTDQWSPKVVARLNDYEIKLVKIESEFVWHTHDDTDELFSLPRVNCGFKCATAL